MDEHTLAVLGALGRLVVAATIVERGLAFIFEHDWFIGLFMKKIPDPADPTKTILTSKIPGIKGLIALLSSIGISFGYDFDILHVLFATPAADLLGKLLTGVVIAGGSAGAIAIFQGYLNINKESRDAIIAASKAEAESKKAVAELAAERAKAEKDQAEAEKGAAIARKSIAEAQALRNVLIDSAAAAATPLPTS